MASRRIASLYGWNTVGAALGSLLTVWVILRATDFRHATWIGAALNGACALAALGLARGVEEAPAGEGRAVPAIAELPPPAFLGLGYAASPFTARVQWRLCEIAG